MDSTEKYVKYEDVEYSIYAMWNKLAGLPADESLLDKIGFPFMSRYDLKTIEELVEMWEKTRMLAGLSHENKLIMAAALDNQRRFNEQYSDSDHFASWKRNSIPLVRRIVAGLQEDGITVTSRISYLYGKYNIIDPTLEWDLYSEENRPEWEKCHIRLDWECEYVANFVEKTRASFKRYMTENNFESFDFKAIGWFNHGRPFGSVAFYGNFTKGTK